MTFDIVSHLNVSGISQTDEWVQKRTKAIEQLATAFRKRDAGGMLVLAEAIIGILAKGFRPLPEDLKNEVFNAVRKAAPKYVPDKNGDAELGTCATLAAVVAVTGQRPNELSRETVSFAAALESGASFLEKAANAKLELLRRAIVQSLGDALHFRSEWIRSRGAVTLPASIPDTKPEEAIGPYVKRVVAPSNTAIGLLNSNALKDREELDLLWWRLSLESTMLGKRFSTMAPHLAPLIAPLEVASILTTTPPGDGIRSIAASVLPETEKTASLAQIVEAGAAESTKILAVYSAGVQRVRENPTVFPLLFAMLNGGDASGKAALKAVGVNEDRTLSLRDWCHRTLNEVSLLKRLGHDLAIPLPARA